MNAKAECGERRNRCLEQAGLATAASNGRQSSSGQAFIPPLPESAFLDDEPEAAPGDDSEAGNRIQLTTEGNHAA